MSSTHLGFPRKHAVRKRTCERESDDKRCSGAKLTSEPDTRIGQSRLLWCARPGQCGPVRSSAVQVPVKLGMFGRREPS